MLPVKTMNKLSALEDKTFCRIKSSTLHVCTLGGGLVTKALCCSARVHGFDSSSGGYREKGRKKKMSVYPVGYHSFGACQRTSHGQKQIKSNALHIMQK